MNHSFMSEVVFEHIIVHLLASEFLQHKELEVLLRTHPLIDHLHRSRNRIRVADVCELFHYDLTHASQTDIPYRRKMQCMQLALLHSLHLPSVIRSLRGNHTALYRNPETILDACRDALPPLLLQDLKRVLHNVNPARFVGHTTAAQRTENRRYGNHSSIKNNLAKVVATMNKEERNKFVAVFPSWLERFIPHLHLTPKAFS